MKTPTNIQQVIRPPNLRWTVSMGSDGKCSYLLPQVPGQKLDPKKCIGPAAWSPFLEHAGIPYSRLSVAKGIGNTSEAERITEENFAMARAFLKSAQGVFVPADNSRWFRVVSYVRDPNGLSGVMIDRHLPSAEAWRLFGLDIPEFKPDIPKRLQRLLAPHPYALFGKEVGRYRLNEFDEVIKVKLEEGGTLDILFAPPSGRWPDWRVAGQAYCSARFAKRMLHRKSASPGDLFAITGLMSPGMMKANVLVVRDMKNVDLIVYEPKSSVRAWDGNVFLGVLSEKHGSPARTDIQTAINFELAHALDGKFFEILTDEYMGRIFKELEEEDLTGLKQSIGFYKPMDFEEIVDERGETEIRPIRATIEDWKVWKLLESGVKGLNRMPGFRRARRLSALRMKGFDHDPGRARIGFRVPARLDDPHGDFRACALRGHLTADPTAFDGWGRPKPEGGVLKPGQCYFGGFVGQGTLIRNPNGSRNDARFLDAISHPALRALDKEATCIFIHPDYPKPVKGQDVGDCDDSDIFIFDPAINAFLRALPAFNVKFRPEEAVVEPVPRRFTKAIEKPSYDEDVICDMLGKLKESRLGIGCAVNTELWYIDIFNNYSLVMDTLRAMPQNEKIKAAIAWMEKDFWESEMPMVCGETQRIIDSSKQTGLPIDREQAACSSFRRECPVAGAWMWEGGWEGRGRIPVSRLGTPDEPIPIPTPISAELEAWRHRYAQAVEEAKAEDWSHIWRVPPEMESFQVSDSAARLANQAQVYYNGLLQTKKNEFLAAHKDHRDRVIMTEDEAAISAYFFAEERVHSFIMASGLATEVYVALARNIYNNLPHPTSDKEIPRNEGAEMDLREVRDGILYGKHTVDGFIMALRACGLTTKRTPFRWYDRAVTKDSFENDYGQVREQVVVEKTDYDPTGMTFRIKGTTAHLHNAIGELIEPLSEGEYTLDHGFLLVSDKPETPPCGASSGLTVRVVDGWETKLKAATGDKRAELEQARRQFIAMAGSVVKLKPTLYEGEPAVEVFSETDQHVGWITKDTLIHLFPWITDPAVGEVRGALAWHIGSSGTSPYALDLRLYVPLKVLNQGVPDAGKEVNNG
jgi:hypothetical protein